MTGPALLAWFVLPRELGLAGPWVPAAIDCGSGGCR